MSNDDFSQPELTERQEKILALIVREYVNGDSPDPIGSKYLTEHFLQNVSSATVRNEMVVLERLGFIAHPHTSSGRVPTEAGYRYFVKQLLDENELAPTERERIAEEIGATAHDIDASMRLAVTSLAKVAQGAAIMTAPRAVHSQYKHLALLAVQGRMAMMVLVLHGGYVRQQMLTLSEPMMQEALSAAANRLNARCEAMDAIQLHALIATAENELDREILELIVRILEERDDADSTMYRDGLTDLLNQFSGEAAKQALRMMEEQTVLFGIMNQMLEQPIGEVQVVIAGDGRWDEVRHLSLVLSRYGVAGRSVGSMAVFGPTRMRYGRAISAVRYISNIMSNLLIDVYGDDASNRKRLDK